MESQLSRPRLTRLPMAFDEDAGQQKGIKLTFPNFNTEAASADRSNASKLGDVGKSPGKSYLFFLTGQHPGIRLFGDRVRCPALSTPILPPIIGVAITLWGDIKHTHSLSFKDIGTCAHASGAHVFLYV